MFEMCDQDCESVCQLVDRRETGGAHRADGTSDDARLLCGSGWRINFRLGGLVGEADLREGRFEIREASEFKSGFAGGGAGDALAQEFLVIGENAASLATTGNGDVELFAADRGKRARGREYQHLINGLALRCVGGDGVAVAERPVFGREDSAISERDGTGWCDILYSHDLAVDQTLFTSVALQ